MKLLLRAGIDLGIPSFVIRGPLAYARRGKGAESILGGNAWGAMTATRSEGSSLHGDLRARPRVFADLPDVAIAVEAGDKSAGLGGTKPGRHSLGPGFKWRWTGWYLRGLR